MTKDSKTPEQLAVEWLKEEYGDTSNWTYMGQEMSLDAFYAGYQAAKPQWIMGVQEDLGNMTVTGIMLAKVVDYAAKHYPDDESEQNHIAQQSYLDGLLAGYQAAVNSPEKQDTCEHILNMEKMIDVNPSSGWTSVYDALPETDEDLLWCNPHSGIVIVAPYNHKFSGELGEQYFTHWMVVPAMPKGEA